MLALGQIGFSTKDRNPIAGSWEGSGVSTKDCLPLGKTGIQYRTAALSFISPISLASLSGLSHLHSPGLTLGLRVPELLQIWLWVSVAVKDQSFLMALPALEVAIHRCGH